LNPPDDYTLLNFIKEWLWAPTLALIGWAWHFHTKRVDDLRLYVDKQDDEISSEVSRQRDVSAKIFDKLEEHARRSEDRHVEVLKALHRGLDGKADK
jgi:hypothetical protein